MKILFFCKLRVAFKAINSSMNVKFFKNYKHFSTYILIIFNHYINFKTNFLFYSLTNEKSNEIRKHFQIY